MDTRAIDTLLEQAVADGVTAGTTAMAANADGLLYQGAAGKREIGGAADMDLDTVIYIASMTKAITGAAAMLQVERGELALDQPCSDLLPEMADLQVLEGFDGDQPRLRPARTIPTLQQLLTHSSGFAYEIWNADMLRYQQVTGTPSIIEGRKATLEGPLCFDPGTRWAYGQGIAVAGRMIEESSGQDLQSYLLQNLFEPLGMHSTAFILDQAMLDTKASLHLRGADGRLEVFPFVWPQDADFQMGGEGLYGSTRDYMRFLRMILGRGELDGARVLKPETVDLMAQNHLGELDVQHLPTAQPHLALDTDFFPGMQQKWGLSFLINTRETAEGRSAGSLSWAGLSNCYYWIDLKKQVTGVICNQQFPFFDPGCMDVFRRFERSVYDGLQ